MTQYYTTIKGKKYDRKLIELADSVTQGKGDGRISLQDARLILHDVMDANSYTQIEKSTVQYIRKNYKFTQAADNYFRKEIRQWAATKKTVRKQNSSSKSASSTKSGITGSANSNKEPDSQFEVPASRKKIFILLFVLVIATLGLLLYFHYSGCKKPVLESGNSQNTAQEKPGNDKNLKTPVASDSSDQEKLESMVLLFPKNNRSVHNQKIKELIKDTAAILNANPTWKIEIQGHTCSEDKSGANQKISTQRARLIQKELMELGIASDRLISKGYADSKPAFPNDSIKNRINNRRVVFSLIKSN